MSDEEVAATERPTMEPTSNDDDDDGVEKNETSSDEHNEEEGQLRFWDIVALQSTFATAGGIVLMPYIFGIYGYIGGPLTLLAYHILTYGLHTMVCDLVVQSGKRLRTLGEFGDYLAGPLGRGILSFMQIFNIIVYLPSALENIAYSFQYIFDFPFGGCLGWWKLIAGGLMFLFLLFVRQWKEGALASYVMLSISSIQAFILFPIAMVQFQDEYYANTDTGKPIPFGSDPPTSWADYALGFPAYFYCGIWILVETMADAKDPRDYKKAFGYAYVIMYLLYMVSGLVCIFIWGWNVKFPIYPQIPVSPIGILVVLSVLLPTFLDYVLSAFIINNALERKCTRKRFKEKASSSPYGLIGFAYQTNKILPATAFAIAVCTLVPNFLVLSGISTAFTVIPVLTFTIPLLHKFGKLKGHFSDDHISNGWIRFYTYNSYALIFFGIIIFVFITAGVFDALITSSYNNFFCEQLGS
jgi:hypothetical protein